MWAWGQIITCLRMPYCLIHGNIYLSIICLLQKQSIFPSVHQNYSIWLSCLENKHISMMVILVHQTDVCVFLGECLILSLIMCRNMWKLTRFVCVIQRSSIVLAEACLWVLALSLWIETKHLHRDPCEDLRGNTYFKNWRTQSPCRKNISCLM